MSSERTWRLWVVTGVPAVMAFGVGAGLGFFIAYQQSLGGFNVIGAALLGMILGALIAVAVVVGTIGALLPNRRGRKVVAPAFGAACLLAVGGLGGYAVVPIADLGFHEPVVLMARGEASVTLHRPSEGFAASAGSPADCWSGSDQNEVHDVVASNLGELGSGTLRVDFYAAGALTTGEDLGVSFWIDGADLPEGATQPFWRGSGTVVRAASAARSGMASFTADLAVDPANDPDVEPISDEWPAGLAGEVRWTCDEWFDPEAEPAGPVAGTITLGLELDGRSEGTDNTAVCDLEPSGSVWAINGSAGTLDGAVLNASIDLYGNHIAGDEVPLHLAVQLSPSEKGDFVPSWDGMVELVEIRPDDRSGRATFDDLPFVPPMGGWPASLSGEISWDCD